MQFFRELNQTELQHRLAARDDDVLGVAWPDRVEDLLNGQVAAFGLPRREGRVAEPAPQVAAGRPDKNGRRAGELAFALGRRVDFGNSHGHRQTKGRPNGRREGLLIAHRVGQSSF